MSEKRASMPDNPRPMSQQKSSSALAGSSADRENDLGSCPACGQDRTRYLGRLPDTTFFGGVYHEHSFPGGQLLRCGRCTLGFRHPRYPEAELQRFYRAVSPEHWSVPAHERNDFAAIRRHLARKHGDGGLVLDVGCHTGALLDLLPDAWEKFGVEPNARAAEVAARQGVRVLGGDVGCLEAYRASFDAVTAVDVLEHVYQPVEFLDRLGRSLRPGGTMLISTGNMDASTWRLMGAKYYYCSLAEHVTFLSRSWCAWVAKELGMQIVFWTTYAHHRTVRPGHQHARDLGSNLAFRFAPTVFRMMAARRRPAGREHLPPVWSTAPDHFLCALQKVGDG